MLYLKNSFGSFALMSAAHQTERRPGLVPRWSCRVLSGSGVLILIGSKYMYADEKKTEMTLEDSFHLSMFEHRQTGVDSNFVTLLRLHVLVTQKIELDGERGDLTSVCILLCVWILSDGCPEVGSERDSKSEANTKCSCCLALRPFSGIHWSISIIHQPSSFEMYAALSHLPSSVHSTPR